MHRCSTVIRKWALIDYFTNQSPRRSEGDPTRVRADNLICTAPSRKAYKIIPAISVFSHELRTAARGKLSSPVKQCVCAPNANCRAWEDLTLWTHIPHLSYKLWLYGEHDGVSMLCVSRHGIPSTQHCLFGNIHEIYIYVCVCDVSLAGKLSRSTSLFSHWWFFLSAILSTNHNIVYLLFYFPAACFPGFSAVPNYPNDATFRHSHTPLHHS